VAVDAAMVLMTVDFVVDVAGFDIAVPHYAVGLTEVVTVTVTVIDLATASYEDLGNYTNEVDIYLANHSHFAIVVDHQDHFSVV